MQMQSLDLELISGIPGPLSMQQQQRSGCSRDSGGFEQPVTVGVSNSRESQGSRLKRWRNSALTCSVVIASPGSPDASENMSRTAAMMSDLASFVAGLCDTSWKDYYPLVLL